MIFSDKMTKAGFVLLFLCLHIVASSQEYFDVASTNFHFFYSHYKGNPKEKVNMQINKTQFSLPFHSEKKVRPYFGGKYYYSSLDPVTLTQVQHNRMTALRFDFGFIYDINDQLSFTTIASSGLHSDLEDYSVHDFQVGTQIYFENKQTNGTYLKYGVEYRRAAFGNSILPLIGYQKKLSPRVRINLQLPYQAELRYAIRPKKIITGLVATYQQQSFRLADFYERDYLRNDQVFGFAFLELMLWKEVAVWGRAGIPLYIENGIYKKDQTYTDILWLEKPKKKIAEPYHADLATGITFEVGVAYRLWLDE